MLIGALALSAAGAHLGCGGDPAPSDWPTPGAAQATLSATFGPRRQGSNDLYDFHRGLDILVPFGSPVSAIAPGLVDAAGDDPNFDPNTVRVLHCLDPDPPASITSCREPMYTMYSHLSDIRVKTGQSLPFGARIGSSGRGDSGLEHLHFETRLGDGSKANAVHPLRFLPYPDSGPPSVAIDAVDFTDPGTVSVSVTASAPAGELDIVRVEVELIGLADGVVLSSQGYDYEGWNQLYAELLDDPTIANVTVDPDNFNGRDPSYSVRFDFHGMTSPLPRAEVRVVARVTDLLDQSSDAAE